MGKKGRVPKQKMEKEKRAMFLNLVKSDTVKMCKVKADAHDTMYQI